MDGNGRWAALRGMPRAEGHRAGTGALRRTVEAAPELGISTLSVYAFSSDNWKRPAAEVSILLGLLAWHLDSETARCIETGVRVQVIGRRDRLPVALRNAIRRAEMATSAGNRLELRIAIDYSARDSMARAAELPGGFSAMRDARPVDLLIRTGGEQRLSDFLLWECAYAELLFTPVMWPDFGAEDLRRAIREFSRRQRRFGAVPEAVAWPPAHERWLR